MGRGTCTTQAESNNTVTVTMAIAFQWGQGISILQYKKLYVLTLTPKLLFCCHDVSLFYSRDLKEQHRVRWALVNNLLQQRTPPRHAFGLGASPVSDHREAEVRV